MRIVGLTLLLLGVSLQACVDCDEVKGEASSLKASYVACEQGDECVVAEMHDLAGPNNCLAPFQCATAFNADKSLDKFKSKARELVDDFKQCNECAMASCGPSKNATAECDAAIGECVLVGGEY